MKVAAVALLALVGVALAQDFNNNFNNNFNNDDEDDGRWGVGGGSGSRGSGMSSWGSGGSGMSSWGSGIGQAMGYGPSYGSSYGPSSYGPSSYGLSSYGPSSYGPSSYGHSFGHKISYVPLPTQKKASSSGLVGVLLPVLLLTLLLRNTNTQG